MRIEYTGLAEINGALIALDGVKGVAYDELAEITLRDGSRRHGRVILIDGERVVLEVFEGTSGIDLKNTGTRFLGKPMTLALSEELLGRLGKHRTAVSCVYVNKLADIDLDVLEQLVRHAWTSAPRSC